MCANVFSQGEFFFFPLEKNVDCVHSSNHGASSEIQPVRGLIDPEAGWDASQPPKKKINKKVFPVGCGPIAAPLKFALQAAVMSLMPDTAGEPSYQTLSKHSP